MPRPVSKIWKYLQKINPDKAQCNICSAVLSTRHGTTTNLARHLRLKHPTIESLSTDRIVKQKQQPPEFCEVTLNNVYSDVTENFSITTLDEEELEKLTTEQPSCIITIPSTSPIMTASAPSPPTVSQKVTTVTKQLTPKKLQMDHKPLGTKPLTASRSSAIDFQMLKFIIKGYHPFTVVESREFQKLLIMLNNSYKIPSRKILSHNLLDILYKNTMESVKDCVKNASFACLTTEGWTSIRNISYFSITVHYLNSDCEMQTALLSTYKYQGELPSEDISNEFFKVTSEWEINSKIVACVTDNASNMVKAVELRKWWHIPCFAHSLNQAVQSSIELLDETRKKVRNIVEFFKHSPPAVETLHILQKENDQPLLNVKQDCPSRWNSTFLMFSRILEIKEFVLGTLSIMNAAPLLNLNEEDWLVIEKSCTILTAFDEITEEMSSENFVPVSKINLLASWLLRHCESYKTKNYDSVQLNAFVKKLFEEVSKNIYERYQALDFLKEATFLDPRFKQFGFKFMDGESQFKMTKEVIINECCNIRKALDKTEGKEVHPSKIPKKSNKSAIWKAFDDAAQSKLETPTRKSEIWKTFDDEAQSEMETRIHKDPRELVSVEVDQYIKMPVLPRKDDPLKWWLKNRVVFPTLYELMKRRMCLVATSVPCERLFTKCGNLLNDRRSRLMSDKVTKMVFLNANLKE